jgi:FlaA1/EpsC-like NDP-sugar epimerase
MIILSKYKKPLFFVLDIILITLSVWLAFFLRFEGKIPEEQISNIKGLIALVLVSSLPVLYFFKLYSFSLSFISAEELVALIKVNIFSFLFSATVVLIFRDEPVFIGFPRSVLFISYFLIFLFCGASRFSKRAYTQMFKRGLDRTKEKTLIVGAGDAGEQILRSILNSRSSSYQPVGFVDDNKFKQGVIIHGIQVLGKIEDIPAVVEREDIEGMIIALPSAGSKTIKRAVGLGNKAGLKKIKIVPSVTEVINGEVNIRVLREVRVEDLLGREQVFLNQRVIENFILNKTILIIGAAGSIGSELCRQVIKFKPSSILILDQDETGIFNIEEELKDNFEQTKIKSVIADILDKQKIEKIFNEFKPNIVFHAAAYKHVPLMEVNPDEAIKNNVFGTKNVAEISLKYGVEKFVFISTDKAINPSSVMGATKRIGEMICQSLNQKNNTKFISVRFGNVLDSRGSVIPIFREQIRRKGPVEVTDSQMKRYFMLNSEACLLVMQAGAMGQGGEVFVLDMGEPIKILDLANEMIKLSGFEPNKDIPIVFTGIRPGEKLIEEILTTEEGVIATKNKKIFITKLSKINEEKLDQGLKKLKTVIQTGNQKEIRNILRKIIPSYNPRDIA